MENNVCKISWKLVENWLRTPRNSFTHEFNLNQTRTAYLKQGIYIPCLKSKQFSSKQLLLFASIRQFLQTAITAYLKTTQLLLFVELAKLNTTQGLYSVKLNDLDLFCFHRPG